MDSIRWKLRAVMARKGWTMSSLGDAIGVHRSVLSRFFRGETDLRASVYMRLLTALGIDLDEALVAAFNGQESPAAASPPVDLWPILSQLDGFILSGVLDRILSSARRQGVEISEKDRQCLIEYKQSLLVIDRKQGGIDGSSSGK